MKGSRPVNPLMREFSRMERGEHGVRVGIGEFTILLMAMKYSWAIPDYRVARLFKRLLPHNRIFDLGAGTGYWAWYLSQYGYNVLAADKQPHSNEWATGNFFPVMEGSTELIRRNRGRTLLLVYPPPGEFGLNAVETYHKEGGRWLVLVGSSNGRHWGSNGLFQHLKNCWEEVGGVALRTYCNPADPFQTMLWVLRRR